MKKLFIIFILANLLILNVSVLASDRTKDIMKADTTERLENIRELKKNIRSMKVRLKSFDIAIAEAAKKPANYRKAYSSVKKVAEVVTTISLTVVTISAYRAKKLTPSKAVKPASLVAAISSSIAGISGVLADLSDNDLELLNSKVQELKLELTATEKSLNEETYILCSQEPSNQMCTNFVHR